MKGLGQPFLSESRFAKEERIKRHDFTLLVICLTTIAIIFFVLAVQHPVFFN